MTRHLIPNGTDHPPTSIVIEAVQPELDCGRYPVKREEGDVLDVTADIFREGHDKIMAVLRYRRENQSKWLEVEMRPLDNDRWAGSFLLSENTTYRYTIEAFPDHFGTWRDEVEKKVDVSLDVASELLEGRAIVTLALERSTGEDHAYLEDLVLQLDKAKTQARSVQLMLHDDLAIVMRRNRSRSGGAALGRELRVTVDRVRARYAAWYELFPRSAGQIPGKSGTFADAADRLPAIRAMGFDVIYFPPIHPIGTVNRKGPNNALAACPGDPGCPYAIGNAFGGHDAIEPSLGTLEEFDAFVGAARDLGMDVALDLAIQCAPDHPWATEHPDWFFIRPDGSIKYAENPPKKYQDIYPINFHNPDWRNLWDEIKRVVLFWVEHGVNSFRVDNPHTKPTVFWEWLIGEVQKTNPEVIFLSEAFTRPKVMRSLAKAGFSQSYTYFTWRNFKQELTDYLFELTQTDVREYLRGNLFTSTHDILPLILQEGGRPAFKMRLALAATLSSVYGMYSGYELCENSPIPGKEEYLDSEKYVYKVWDWDRPGNIINYVTTINRIRREHPALHEYDNLRFYPAENNNVVCFGKATADLTDIIVAVVNLDPFQPHESTISLPLESFGLAPDEQFRAIELISGEQYIWSGNTQTIQLDPHDEPAKLFALDRWARVEYAEPCF